MEFEGISNAVSGGAKNNPSAKHNNGQIGNPSSQVGTNTATMDGNPSANSQVPVDSSGQPVLTPEQNRVANGVQNYLGRTVDRRDLLTAGNIIISCFSWGEINYLYSKGWGLRNAAEAHEVRNLLLSRLGSGDIATLRGLAGKYGLSLKVLDANFDIDKAYGIKK